MRFIIMLTISVVLVTCSAAHGEAAVSERSQFTLTPQPQLMVFHGKDSFKLNSELTITLNPCAPDNTTGVYIPLRQRLQKLLDKSVPLSVKDEDVAPDEVRNTILFARLDTLPESFIGQVSKTHYPPEAYLIDCSPERILLAANDAAGFMHASVTLCHILSTLSPRSSLEIPTMQIVDWAEMPFRSVYCLPTGNLQPEYITQSKAVIEQLAFLKYNMASLANQNFSMLERNDSEGMPMHTLMRELFDEARAWGIEPRVEGSALYFRTGNEWSPSFTALEGIRTSCVVTLKGETTEPLRSSAGDSVSNVMYDPDTGKSWAEEPVIVQSIDGKITYKEGADFTLQFGKITSPLFDKCISGEGEPAGFPLRKAESKNPPTLISRILGGAIQDGQRVKVTFTYVGPDPWQPSKYRYCRSESRLHLDSIENPLWRWCTQPIQYLNAHDFQLTMDEVRVFAFDQRCLSSEKSRSQIFVDDLAYYYRLIKERAPDARILMWSDMIDPVHNATLYKTTGAASLIKKQMPDIIMVPWWGKETDSSVHFLAENGFKVMASAYNTLADSRDIIEWWTALRKYVPNCSTSAGMQYTTWSSDFSSDVAQKRLANIAQVTWSNPPILNVQCLRDLTKPQNPKIVFSAQPITPEPFCTPYARECQEELNVTTITLYYAWKDVNGFSAVQMEKDKQGLFTAQLPIPQDAGQIIWYCEGKVEDRVKRLPVKGVITTSISGIENAAAKQ